MRRWRTAEADRVRTAWVTARGEHDDRRRRVDDVVHDRSHPVDDLLAVVDQEQHRPVGEEAPQGGERGAASSGIEAEGRGDPLGDPAGGVRVGVGHR